MYASYNLKDIDKQVESSSLINLYFKLGVVIKFISNNVVLLVEEF
jgi:hypothetical protein